MKRKLFVVAIMMMVILALSGCGGSGHDDVKAQLSGNSWYYNGGSDTILNKITFGEESATISQITFDGNGDHNDGGSDFEYSIDDSNIVVTMADGSELTIPYTLDGETLSFVNGEYFTIDEVDAFIQGAWTTGIVTSSWGGRYQYDILFADGKVSSQNGSKALDNSGYDYYYSIDDPVAYTLGDGTLESDLMQSSSWGFNIINGVPTVLRYDTVCQRTSGLPDVEEYEKLCD